jgi:hypothetical protein
MAVTLTYLLNAASTIRFHPEDGGCKATNVGILPQHYTTSQPRRPQLEYLNLYPPTDVRPSIKKFKINAETDHVPSNHVTNTTSKCWQYLINSYHFTVVTLFKQRLVKFSFMTGPYERATIS